MVIDADEIKCNHVDEDGIAHYSYMMSPREMEGPMDASIAFLRSFDQPSRVNLRIEYEHGYEGDDWLYVRWERKLSPEEIAKRERDEREDSARHAAMREQIERAEYARLKAKFGD